MDEILIPARVISPGDILKKELKARGWAQRDLSFIIGRPTQTINEIAMGRKEITAETAKEFAEAFGTSDEFWMNLETNYRLHLAKKGEAKREVIARRSNLFSKLPLREILKLGWIVDTEDLDQLEHEICKFLNISDINMTPAITASLRQSDAFSPESTSELAWARRVEILADKQIIGTYSKKFLLDAIPEILLCAGVDLPLEKLSTILARAGVHFVIVPHLSKTYMDGAALIQDRTNPIVALTLRYDRVDSFWFTLLHEIAHIVLEHQGVFLDDTEKHQHYVNNQNEAEANALARNWLVPQNKLNEFITQSSPYFSEEKVINFAKRLNRHPGIVVGQLHNSKAVPYMNLRSWLVKISPQLSHLIEI